MKKLLLLFALLATTLSSRAASISINVLNFPDEAFRDYIFGNFANANSTDVKYNWAADGVLDDDEIAALTELHIDGAVHSHSASGTITDMTGIEYFTNLEILSINYQPLVTLDLSHNTKLKKLDMWCDSQLTSLDLSPNVMLEKATVKLETLRSLNVTNCANLRRLDCTSNTLKSLDVSHCPLLTHLSCSNNNLDSLDLSGCPLLTRLVCGNNFGLKSVNLSQCTELDSLYLGNSRSMKSIDITHNTKLKYVEFYQSTSLRAVDFSHNTELLSMDCSKCTKMKTLDVSGLPNIQKLICREADTMSVNVANCNNLKSIDLSGTLVDSIDVSQCPALKQLLVSNCGLKSLDVSKNSQLTKLDCGYNQLYDLRLGNIRIPNLDFVGQKQKPTGYIYTYDGKIFLYGLSHIKNRIVNFKVNGDPREVNTTSYYDLLLLGNEGDSIINVSFDVNTGYIYDTCLLNVTFTPTGKRRLIHIDQFSFPNEGFRSLVSTQISDDPRYLKQDVAEGVHKLDLEGLGMLDVRGIEYFCNLDTLWCPANDIRGLDVSSLPNLKFLNCSRNSLSPVYDPTAVPTLLESLPDNTTEKTLYYRDKYHGNPYEFNADLTWEQCQYLKSKHWTPMELKYVNDAYEWVEYTGTVVSDSIIVGNTLVSNANYADVLGDGKVSYDPIRNVLTLNGVHINQVSLENLWCSRDGLVIKLLGTNTISERATFNKNTTIIGPGTLNVRMLSREHQVMINNGACLHIGDSAQVNIIASSSGYAHGTGIRGSEGSTLKVDGSNAQLTVDAKQNAVTGLGNLELGDGYCIETPIHSVFDPSDGTVYNSAGDPTTSFVIKYAPIYGDTDNDTYFTLSDVDSMVSILLGNAPRTIVADTNRDGDVSIADLTALVDRLNSPYGWVVKPVTNFALNQTTIALAEGGTQNLTIRTLEPEDADFAGYRFTSSDESVATVGERTGVVTAVGEGTCVITCLVLDGGNMTATCTVNVVTAMFVDLGLPSGTQWAKMNVGATAPEGWGKSYAWGETASKTNYVESTYFDQTSAIFNNHGGLTSLTPAYDAACQHEDWGAEWETPTMAQFEELFDTLYTTVTVETLNNNKGVRVTSKANGKSIFLPYSGYMSENTSTYRKRRGYYWTREIDGTDDTCAKCATFITSLTSSTDWRYLGMPIRPVKKQ